MFNGKGNHGSASGRAQTAGRAELQRQLEERLSYWRLFLEAKQAELEERRNPAGLPDTAEAATGSAVPVERAGTARTRARRAVEELTHATTPVVAPPTADDLPRVDGEAT